MYCAFRSMNGTVTWAGAPAWGAAGSSNFNIRRSPLIAISHESGRAAADHRPGLNVLRHHRPGTDQGPGADRDAGQDDRPAADRRALADARRHHLPVRLGLRPAVGRGPRVEVVDEHD